MTAYRIRVSMGGQSVDKTIEAPDHKSAILKLSEQVASGEVKLVSDGFTGNKRVHITYEEIVNVFESNKSGAA